MKCQTCGSFGFKLSFIEGKCEFCDGTASGNPPKITGVAVRITLRGFSEVHVLPPPNRHHNILHNLKIANTASVEEGFVVENQSFISREDAFKLATLNNQLKRREGTQYYQGPKLFSEDLW